MVFSFYLHTTATYYTQKRFIGSTISEVGVLFFVPILRERIISSRKSIWSLLVCNFEKYREHCYTKLFSIFTPRFPCNYTFTFYLRYIFFTSCFFCYSQIFSSVCLFLFIQWFCFSISLYSSFTVFNFTSFASHCNYLFYFDFSFVSKSANCLWFPLLIWLVICLLLHPLHYIIFISISLYSSFTFFNITYFLPPVIIYSILL